MKVSKESGLLSYLLGQTLILIGFYYPWLSNSASYFFRDLTHYNEPYARFTGDCLSRLQLPLWNPWCYCGMPQIAICVQGVFYPFTWLFAILPFNSGLSLNMLIHQVLLGLGGFLLVGSFGWGFWPSVLCAVTLAMSGYEFCLSSIVSLVQTSAWCPLALWSVMQLGKQDPKTGAGGQVDSTKSPWLSAAQLRILIAALTVAMLVLSGHPELGLLEFALIGAVLCQSTYKEWKSGLDGWKEKLVLRVKAMMIGILLAMPSILPTYEWLGLSRRSSGLDPKEALILSANWYDMLLLFLLQPLGDLQQRGAEFRSLVMEGQLVPYVAAAYIGPVILTLAFWSLFDRKWRERWLLLGLLLFVLMLALGSNTFLVPLILSIAKSSIRFPIKLMFFAVWCLAIMAARGLYFATKTNLQESRSSANSASADLEAPGHAAQSKDAEPASGDCGSIPFVVSASVWGVLLFAAVAVFSGAHILGSLLSSSPLSPERLSLLPDAERAISGSLIQASLVGLLVSGLGYWRSAKPAILSCFPQCIVALSAVSLLIYGMSFCRNEGPKDFYSTESFAAAALSGLNSDRSKNGSNSDAKFGLSPKSPRVLGLYLEHFTVPEEYLASNGQEASVKTFQYSRQLLRPNTNIDQSMPSAFGFEGSCTGDYYNFVINCYGISSQATGIEAGKGHDLALARICQVTATRYVLTQVYRFGKKPGEKESVPLLDKQLFQLAQESEKMNLRIYQIQTPLPRAYFTDCWDWCESRDEMLEKQFKPEESGFNPLKKTYLESGDLSRSPRYEPEVNERTNDSTVSIAEDNNNSLTISIDAKRDGYMVLADQYYPGWVAQLDGAPAPILCANAFTRAVHVPQGKHTVRFDYQPGSLFAGLALFLLACLWILYLFFQESKANDASSNENMTQKAVDGASQTRNQS